MYYDSKNDGEKLAFELAKKHNIELVAVLPSAMIGSTAFAPLNVSYNIISLILKKKIPVETNIMLNWIDVKDVAEGCYLAINGKAPLLSTKDIAMFSGLQQNFDITKARTELGFNPKNSIQAVKEAMHYLRENENRLS